MDTPGSTKAKTVAGQVAKELFLSSLSEKQRHEFERYRKFRVVDKYGAEWEVVFLSLAYKTSDVFSCYVEGRCGEVYGLPMYDTLLATKLMIEADVDEYIRLTNRVIIDLPFMDRWLPTVII
jgi:hypothetical protein